MRPLITPGLFVVTAALQAQTIPNPGFESNCTFDMTGWSWFCSVPDHYPTDGPSSCYALALPTSDGFDPCFSNGELIGVHTPMSGFVTGIPYQLSLYENMSAPGITSDCGIFAMPSGQLPSSFGSTTPISVWGLGMNNPGVWMQDVMPFTLPTAYAGWDFYFFIEYSAAPDPEPGLKYFDDISFTDLSTGLASNEPAPLHHWPDPATDQLRVDLPEAPTSILAIDVTGRGCALTDFHLAARTLEVNVGSLPSGVHLLQFTTASGIRSIRFLKA